MSTSSWMKIHYLQLIIASVGIVLVGIGVVKMVTESKGHTVEVRDAAVSEENGTGVVKKNIMVDVAGAVEKPGVYTLAEGSRVVDALAAAGGMAMAADRTFVSRYVNQAQMVVDGMKLYIPQEGESPVDSVDLAVPAGGVQVSVNTASREQLEELWGIGEARAQQIIDNRPYKTLEELTSKAGVSKSVLERNAGKIGI